MRFFIALGLSLLTMYILTTLSETVPTIDILRPYLPVAIPIVIAVIVVDMVIEIVNKYRALIQYIINSLQPSVIINDPFHHIR